MSFVTQVDAGLPPIQRRFAPPFAVCRRRAKVGEGRGPWQAEAVEALCFTHELLGEEEAVPFSSFQVLLHTTSRHEVHNDQPDPSGSFRVRLVWHTFPSELWQSQRATSGLAKEQRKKEERGKTTTRDGPLRPEAGWMPLSLMCVSTSTTKESLLISRNSPTLGKITFLAPERASASGKQSNSVSRFVLINNWTPLCLRVLGHVYVHVHVCVDLPAQRCFESSQVYQAAHSYSQGAHGARRAVDGLGRLVDGRVGLKLHNFFPAIAPPRKRDRHGKVTHFTSSPFSTLFHLASFIREREEKKKELAKLSLISSQRN